MDLAALIKAPTQDKDWVSKCAIIGLMALVPIAGILNLMGWMKATYANVKAGDAALPSADFGYIAAGWEMFLAILPPFLVLVVLGFAEGVLGMIPKFAWLATLVNIPVQLVSLANTVVLMPILVFRHVTQGKGFQEAFDIEGIKVVLLKKNFVGFALTYFVANIIGGLGIIACCFGVFLTFPFASAVHAHAVKVFEDTISAESNQQ
jgi:hypothetical protein